MVVISKKASTDFTHYSDSEFTPPGPTEFCKYSKPFTNLPLEITGFLPLNAIKSVTFLSLGSRSVLWLSTVVVVSCVYKQNDNPAALIVE